MNHNIKNILKKTGTLVGVSVLAFSCSKFDEINIDPKSANEDQVQIEYFINASIVGAQMNPDVAERSFVLYWKTGGHQHRQNGLSIGDVNDEWTSAYYNSASRWLNNAYTAVQIGENKIASGDTQPYTVNLVQVARIWRAYVLSEMSDNFGPMPINGFEGSNPDFADVKSVYYFALQELKEAAETLDVSIINPDNVGKQDPAYGYDYTKWKKYANSLRMRLAMRLSEVDAAKAKMEFEDASKEGLYISTVDESFQIQEKPGWDDLTGVMSREWNEQQISATLNNLYIGLGGITSDVLVQPALHNKIKDGDYIGLRFTDHFATSTNDPSAGYWLDGLPKIIDPRAYKTFIIPGDLNNPDYSLYPTYTDDAKTTSRNLMNANGAVQKTIDATYTWNAFANGSWGTKGSRNQVYTYIGTNPRLSQKFRNSASIRIFFAPWETHFLLAEAAVRGWATLVPAKESYENGVKASFEYWGVSSFAGAYLSSTSYNRVGTSVSWDHVSEPGNSHSMRYVDGYTNVAGNVDILYPKNDLYKDGSIRNDHLTKIITQKFIAQCPWLPLETWSDHRRLGLPFFENPAVEQALPNMPNLNNSNYMTSSTDFFPQRLRYPSGIRISNANGYNQAIGYLGGAETALIPLWWAKQ